VTIITNIYSSLTNSSAETPKNHDKLKLPNIVAQKQDVDLSKV
jgi:hypothetical protein